MRRNVLVPLDLSNHADRALPVAGSLADRIGARLDVVSLTSPGIDPLHTMTEARAHARGMGVDVDAIHIRHDEDVAGGVLAIASTDGAIPCCATHARDRVGEWLLQSVSADLIRRSTAPLVLVGPEVAIDPRPTFTEIVACVDHSFLTPRVVSTAASWSRQLAAKVRLLDVVGDRTEMPGAWEPTKRLATSLTALGIDAMPEVLAAGDPAEAILHTAAHLSGPLLIVGAHGHREVDHPALGRVSLAVVRRSPCAVVVVPNRGARQDRQ